MAKTKQTTKRMKAAIRNSIARGKTLDKTDKGKASASAPKDKLLEQMGVASYRLACVQEQLAAWIKKEAGCQQEVKSIKKLLDEKGGRK